MLKEKELNFIENCDYSTLICMCDDMGKDCWRGAECKRDLISHIVKHYQLYYNYTKEPLLNNKIKLKCEKRRKEIHKIIRKYMMLALLCK